MAAHFVRGTSLRGAQDVHLGASDPPPLDRHALADAVVAHDRLVDGAREDVEALAAARESSDAPPTAALAAESDPPWPHARAVHALGRSRSRPPMHSRALETDCE